MCKKYPFQNVQNAQSVLIVFVLSGVILWIPAMQAFPKNCRSPGMALAPKSPQQVSEPSLWSVRKFLVWNNFKIVAGLSQSMVWLKKHHSTVSFSVSNSQNQKAQLLAHLLKSHLAYSVKSVSTLFSGTVHWKCPIFFLSCIYHTVWL